MKELVLEFEVLSQRIPAGGSIQLRVEIRFFGWSVNRAWRRTLQQKCLICKSNWAAVRGLSEGLNLSPMPKTLACHSVSLTAEKLPISKREPVILWRFFANEQGLTTRLPELERADFDLPRFCDCCFRCSLVWFCRDLDSFHNCSWCFIRLLLPELSEKETILWRLHLAVWGSCVWWISWWMISQIEDLVGTNDSFESIAKTVAPKIVSCAKIVSRAKYVTPWLFPLPVSYMYYRRVLVCLYARP